MVRRVRLTSRAITAIAPCFLLAFANLSPAQSHSTVPTQSFFRQSNKKLEGTNAHQPNPAVADARNEGPDIKDWTPKSVSANSVLELHGFRLSPSALERVVYFLQDGNKYRARTGGGSAVTNDERYGFQTLEVVVPEEVTPGPTQIVLEVNGVRTTPIAVTITPWQLPKVSDISPTRGSPGTLVNICADGFHINDEIELTDVTGKVTSFESGGSLNGTVFTVPKDAPEGPITIRIGNRKYGNHQYTEPFTFFVTYDPLPLEIMLGVTTPVAPGQWIDLQVNFREPVEQSELTELAFKQGGRTIVVTAPNPRQLHFEVPAALSPGDVQLQTRTWRKGRPSVWSEPVQFHLTESPVPPAVGAIRLEKGDWVQLWPGPDRPESFNATAEDVIVINGTFRVADVSKLKVSLVGPSGVIDLAVSELDKNANWFGEVVIRLPPTLEKGAWRMFVASIDDVTRVELPIVIRIN